MIPRSIVLRLVPVVGLLLCLGGAVQARAATLTDLAGRRVELAAPAQRIVLGEGRFLVALGLLDRDDPTRRVVGMMGEFALVDPAGHRQYARAFPRLEKIPVFGQMTSDTVSVEKILALAPDLAVFGLDGHGPAARSRETIDQLTAAGVPILFIDFRQEPLTNTVRSMDLLGRALGREMEAAAFNRFYETELAKVAEGLKGVSRRPSVFLEMRVGMTEECCGTMSEGMMGRFVDFAGGDNIARGLVPGAFGTLGLEHLIARQPEVYVGTAIGAAATVVEHPTRIVLGAGVEKAAAEASLRRAVARPGIDQLVAVRSNRVHAVWHHFYNSPLNVVAVQAFAKWFHPERFSDIDPEATLRALHGRFAPVPLDGVYWISLP
jgi:iron complex transport system substrate-binding protein